MTSLRKKILYSKIQKMFTQNSFVLFFQYNNIQSKQWIFFRNEILKLKNTNVLVIKNKVTHEMFKHAFDTFSNTKYNTKNIISTSFLEKNKASAAKNANSLFLQTNPDFGNVVSNIFEKNQLLSNLPRKPFFSITKKNRQNLEKLLFLCVGPSLVITFDSIEQCKPICEIIELFKQNQSLSLSIVDTEFFNLNAKNGATNWLFPVSKNQKNQKNNFEINLHKNKKLIALLTQKNQKNINLSKSHLNGIHQNKELEKCNFFFVGGLVKNQIINHLDLVKLSTLNNSVYSNLIKQCCSSTVHFLLFKNVLQTKLLRCFKQNTLITILTIHRKNLAFNAFKIN